LKIYGTENEYLRIKELIIDSQLDYNIVILLEQLLLNYMGWNIELVSLTEIIICIAYIIEINKDDWEGIKEYLDDIINYIMSESCIYNSFDQTTLALSILKIICHRNHWYVYLQKLEELYEELSVKEAYISQCINVIDCIFNLEKSENEKIKAIE
jgi:hypothetical protein